MHGNEIETWNYDMIGIHLSSKLPTQNSFQNGVYNVLTYLIYIFTTLYCDNKKFRLFRAKLQLE